MADMQGQSFTRGIFSGQFYHELIFPYPPSLDDSNPDEARVVRSLLSKIEGRLGGTVDPARFDEEETIPEEVIEALAKGGFLGLTIPKMYGGLELSSTGYARVFQAIAALDASLAVFIGVHCGLGSKAIVLYGNEAQKERWLPKLASGEELTAYALTEPDVGSDAQHIKTTATISEDGKSWLLNGTKLWIGNGHRAGIIATFAQTEVLRKGERTQRPTAFLIEPTMPGFEVAGTIRKMGIRGSTQAQLEYRNLQVPVENVLGEIGKGFRVAVNVLNAGRLTLLAGCTGGAKSVVTQMSRYAQQRVQFGSPLADFEITQRKISSLAAETYASDSMLGVISHLATQDKADWSLEAAIGKVFASDLVWKASDEMVQLAGGRGFVKPYPYERQLRDSRINRIFEGANEVLRLFIALNAIQSPAEHLKEVAAALREPMRNWGLLSDYAFTKVRRVFRESSTLDVELHPSLEVHKEYLEKHAGQLKSATEQAIIRHKNEIINRQLVIERLANIAIELFARACTISHTQSLIDQNGLEGASREIDLCHLFCVESGKRVRRERELLSENDEKVDQLRRDVASHIRKEDGYFVKDSILHE